MSIIIQKYKAKQVIEGGGVPVSRVFGYHETDAFDPFLMLDYINHSSGKYLNGFPWHPHKGMETISYLLKGNLKHEDSLGNKGELLSGEVQWMSAGKGILHQEMPGTDNEDGIEAFQFWLNLPAKDKLKEPDYKYIHQGNMKSVLQNGLKVRIIAGKYDNELGPIDKSDLGITLLHITLEKGKEISLTRDSDKYGYIFVFKGDGSMNNDSIEAITAYTLSPGELLVRTESENLEFIFAEGTPLKEPIAWNGPIVMNTQEELSDTFHDLDNGTFIQ